MLLKKVIIPAAGFGTRFLPQTKAMPKEMLPVVDKPVIQYVVEEAVDAGITDVIIVTGWHKRAIEDHFDYPYELEKRLMEWGKTQLIESIREIAQMANFIYIRQKGPYGNATPIRCAEHLIENEPFLVLWGDDFIIASPSRTAQLIKAYKELKAPILCGIRSDSEEDKKRYAFVKGKEVKPGIWRVEELIEKPGKKKAPSHLAIVSGYLLTPDIFPILKKQKPGKGGEFYLSEAIDMLCKKTAVYAVEIKNGKYYDTGNKLAYLQTVIDRALQDKEIGPQLKKYLKKLFIKKGKKAS